MIILPQFSNYNVIVYGDLMLDRYWFGDTRRISPEAPVPVVRIQNMKASPGGAGNVALNLVALGVKTQLLSWVGQDLEAQELKKLLDSAGVTSYLLPLQDYATVSKLRVIGQNQQLLRLDFEDAMMERDDSWLINHYEQILKSADLVILSDYAKGVLKHSARIIELARAHQVPVLVDPKSKDFSCYQGATLITPNQREFEEVVGTCKNETEIIDKAQILIKQHDLQGLLITQGSHGMLLVMAQSAPVKLFARQREIYDVTGAGDTVIAIIGAALAAGLKLPDAAYLANVAAGLVVRKLGAATVTVPELRRELQKSYQMDLGIMSESQLLEAVADAKHHGERIVMTNGCFDILHAGHVQYLEQAKALGDRLIVAVNDDDSVARLKGAGRPINSLAERMSVLASLRAVDWVVPFSEDTPAHLIEQVVPHTLVKGSDYKIDEIAGAEFVIKNGGEVLTLDLKAGFSTTQLLNKIREK